MIYDYKCHECDAIIEDVYNSIEQRKSNAPVHCGEPMHITHLVAPWGYVDNMEEYMCPITNVGITTRTQRNEMMAREGVIDANDHLSTKKQRDAKVAKVEATRALAEKHSPRGVQNQVDQWARKELDL